MFTLFTMVTWSVVPLASISTHVHIVHCGQLGTGPHSPETSSPWYKDLQAVRQWLQCSSDCSTSDLPSVSISCCDCCLNLNGGGGGIDSPVSTDRHTTASGARPHGYRPPWRAALAATETRVAVVVLSYEIRLRGQNIHIKLFSQSQAIHKLVLANLMCCALNSALLTFKNI